jgi:hypothetical protein
LVFIWYCWAVCTFIIIPPYDFQGKDFSTAQRAEHKSQSLEDMFYLVSEPKQLTSLQYPSFHYCSYPGFQGVAAVRLHPQAGFSSFVGCALQAYVYNFSFPHRIQ